MARTRSPGNMAATASCQQPPKTSQRHTTNTFVNEMRPARANPRPSPIVAHCTGIGRCRTASCSCPGRLHIRQSTHSPPRLTLLMTLDKKPSAHTSAACTIAHDTINSLPRRRLHASQYLYACTFDPPANYCAFYRSRSLVRPPHTLNTAARYRSSSPLSGLQESEHWLAALLVELCWAICMLYAATSPEPHTALLQRQD